MSTTVVSVIIVIVVLTIDVWVFVDARRFASQGSPVFFRIGALTIDTPLAWFLGCLILWVFVFPIYLVSRR